MRSAWLSCGLSEWFTETGPVRSSHEVNGKNRSGGMTGYQPQALMLRKHKPEAVE